MPDQTPEKPGDLGGDYARDPHRGGYGDDYARDGGWSGGGSADQYTRETPDSKKPDDPDGTPPQTPEA